MKRDKTIFLFMISCALMLNILAHACHETHDQCEGKTTSHLIEDHSIEHTCENELNCTTCTTLNIDSLRGVLIKTKQLVKQSITSHIFLNNIKNYNIRAIFSFKELYTTIDIIYSIKYITTVILRQ